jgi:hypothetical protein
MSTRDVTMMLLVVSLVVQGVGVADNSLPMETYTSFRFGIFFRLVAMEWNPLLHVGVDHGKEKLQ